jgi:hypothetical protein
VAAKVAAATLAVGAAGTVAGLEPRQAEHHLGPQARAKPPAVAREAAIPSALVRISFSTTTEAPSNTRTERMPAAAPKEHASKEGHGRERTETEHSGPSGPGSGTGSEEEPER